MNKVELLAPAGNFDCLKAAINNGANAVYLGGKNFSARAFAHNFDENEIKEAIKYAHLCNVKIYVTLNTLLTEKEFANAIKMVDFYYKNNVDALLIQDLGLYYYIKDKYPDFELHCSTQMHVHNLEGVRTAKKLGFKRVVLARESTLDFISQACKEGIEIETFVHGAICVSYSGQCLMSSVGKNRSANKGMCAQCCRLRYEILDDDNNKINTKTNYPLSPRDMCLINDIPELIDAGVSSFKIEGRLKSSAYVGYVTRLYRKAIDSYVKQGIKYQITDNELINLKVLFNRNFTDDYLYNRNNIFGQSTPNHLGIEIGNAFKYDKEFVYIKLKHKLNQFDGIRINDFGCIVNMLYKDGLLVNHGDVNDVVAIKADSKQIGKVYKTLDYEFENEINSTPDKKIPLNINVKLIPNEKVMAHLQTNNESFNYISEFIPEIAKNSPLTEESICNQFSKLNDTVYYAEHINIETNNAFLPIKSINEIRRQSIEAFNNYRLNSFERKQIPVIIEFSDCKYDEVGDIKINDDICFYNESKYAVNYVINKDSIYIDENNALISEIGGLLRPYRSKIAYYTLNCSNSYCYEFFKKLGYDAIIVSSELKPDFIKDMIESYCSRNGVQIKPYYLKEGNRVLMYIKANPFDEYVDMNKIHQLFEQNNSYFIRKYNEITEIIENKSNNREYINKQSFTIYK